MDTIYALTSARGRAGVAVIRVSGREAHEAVAKLCPLPALRVASLRRLAWKGEVLDEALVILFAEGHSFTGEAMCELQVHGSTATVAVVMRALGDLGLRMAEPGEFTRRALANGRLDLAQVEGLADLIEAETEAQRRQAMRTLSGALGRKADALKAHLVRAAALIAAVIDFSEEELPPELMTEIVSEIVTARAALSREIDGIGAAERIRDGFEVAITGAPNVGKSSVINALVGREAVITSAIAGTTRDVIELRMDIGGLAVTLLDTAGLRETDDPVEQIGIARARARAAAADLRLVLVVSGGTPPPPLSVADILVWTKTDLRPAPEGSIGVSAITGEGLDGLVRRIDEVLSEKVATAGLAHNERHRVALQRAVQSLDLTLVALDQGMTRLDFAADDLRAAMRALDSLVGRVDVEDLLDVIFSSFCIGK